MYCNPPFSGIFRILRHFLSEKLAAPLGTSALFILPFWVTDDFWVKLVLPLLGSLLHVVKRWEANVPLFTSPNAKLGDRKYCGPTRWPVVAVYCAPADLQPQLRMQLTELLAKHA